MNSAQLSEIVSAFQIEGKVESIESLGAGFINDTFVIRTSEGAPDYILQKSLEDAKIPGHPMGTWY